MTPHEIAISSWAYNTGYALDLIVRHHVDHRFPGSRQRAEPGPEGSGPAVRLQGRESRHRPQHHGEDADAHDRRRNEDERALGDRAGAAGPPRRRREKL